MKNIFQDHGDEVQCVGWQPSGKLVASQCKDKKLRVIDPRSGKVVAESDSHEGIKDSKVVWVGDSQRLLTTGFSSVLNQFLVTIKLVKTLAPNLLFVVLNILLYLNTELASTN
jgi:WD40 repeat protein